MGMSLQKKSEQRIWWSCYWRGESYQIQKIKVVDKWRCDCNHHQQHNKTTEHCSCVLHTIIKQDTF